MGANEKEILSQNNMYDEIGRNYRFFLNWRYVLLAGFFVSLGFFSKALLQAYDCNSIQYQDQLRTKVVIILYIAILVFTIFFFLLEKRNRDLYHYCTQQGEAFEQNQNIEGIYTKLNASLTDSKKIYYYHSIVIDTFFWFWVAASLFGILISLVFPIACQ